MKVYFAHPISDYGTSREADALAVLTAKGWDIENPNQEHHQVGYAAGGMEYFKRIASDCDALVFMRFPNGAIGAGMGKEIGAAQAHGRPVFELLGGKVYPVAGPQAPVLTVEQTRDLLAAERINDE